MEKWKTIKSEPLVDSRWVKVRKDSVDLPNGQHIDDFYAISLNDAAAIVALDDAGNIVLKKKSTSSPIVTLSDTSSIVSNNKDFFINLHTKNIGIALTVALLKFLQEALREVKMAWQLLNENFWKKLAMFRTTGNISEQR